MSVLVIAEHEQGALKPETAKVINAAAKISDNITVLVAGHSVAAVSESAAKIAGVKSVIVADKPVFEHQLAESTADLVVELAPDYSHILASASTTGKNTLPRVAALLDKSQISEIIDVIDADTFKRPIYAGNAIATVKSAEDKKIITVRASAFDAQPGLRCLGKALAPHPTPSLAPYRHTPGRGFWGRCRACWRLGGLEQNMDPRWETFFSLCRAFRRMERSVQARDRFNDTLCRALWAEQRRK